MFEGPHDALIVFLRDALWVAGDCFDVCLEVPLQHLVDLGVVIVVVSDPIHTVNVVPYCLAECRRVHFTVVAHPENIKRTADFHHGHSFVLHGVRRPPFHTLLVCLPVTVYWNTFPFPFQMTTDQGPVLNCECKPLPS